MKTVGNPIYFQGTVSTVEELPKQGQSGDAYLVKQYIYVWHALTNKWRIIGFVDSDYNNAKIQGVDPPLVVNSVGGPTAPILEKEETTKLTCQAIWEVTKEGTKQNHFVGTQAMSSGHVVKQDTEVVKESPGIGLYICDFVSSISKIPVQGIVGMGCFVANCLYVWQATTQRWRKVGTTSESCKVKI